MADTSKRKKFLLITLFVCLLVSPILLLILLGMSSVQGEEFSPDDFSRRSFFYVQLPYVKLTLIGKHYDDRTPALEQIMVTDGLIPTIKNTPQVWHLIHDPGSISNGYPSFDCDARFLTNYLDMTDYEGESIWEKWNKDFPNTAKIFWPVVADLARDEMYLILPAIMRTALAIDKDQPRKFQEILDNKIASSYTQLAAIDTQKGRLNRALKRIDKSLDLVPSQEALQIRSEIQSELGNQSEADADKQKAAKLLPEKE